MQLYRTGLTETLLEALRNLHQVQNLEQKIFTAFVGDVQNFFISI